MPRHCCVPSCKSNYDSTRGAGREIVPTFAFPKDPELRKTWFRAIPRRDWEITNNSAVCIKHFHEIYLEKSGKKRYKLVKGAVPTIFPNLPSYLSVIPSIPRKTSPEKRRERRLIQEEQEKQKAFLEDVISTFQNFLNKYKTKLNLLGWNTMETENRVTFYILEENEETGCEFSVRILINRDLSVRIFLRSIEVLGKDLKFLLPKNCKVTLWSQLENLLSRYKFERNSSPGECEDYIKNAILYLEKANNFPTDSDFSGRLEFVLDQVKLLLQSQPRYSTCTIISSFLILSLSSKAYEQLRNFLCLPPKRYLQYISSPMTISADFKNVKNDEHYIRRMVDTLSKREKYVALLIDQIYLPIGFQHKSDNGNEPTENNTEVARTLVSVMVKSVFGSYKEVIRLIPVSNLTGKFLYAIVLEAIKFIQSLGLQVIVIITDNDRAKQVMFQNFNSTSNNFQNPDFPNDKIFILYDTVHLFKAIRNNWLNVRTEDHTFMYPDFESYEVKKASFEVIRDFYKKDLNLQTKKAYKLNRKTVYPNNLERHNLLLVDNVFHGSTIAALQETEALRETADFCLILNKWWKIVNLNSALIETEILEPHLEPFRNSTDSRIDFLRNFIVWLDTWNQSENNPGILAPDTYRAAVWTTQTLIDLIEYSLTYLNAEYVLPGKFQMEDLEGRFRLYRSLSSCGYRILYSELIDSEKKITKEKRKKYRKILADPNDNSLHEPADISDFLPIFDTEYLSNVEVDFSANFYFCGYVAHAVGQRITCVRCRNFIIKDKSSCVGEEYTELLKRRDICIPSDEVYALMYHMCAIYQEIKRNARYEPVFAAEQNQKGLLRSLTMHSIQWDDFYVDLDYECICSSSSYLIFSDICHSFAIILLNDLL